MNKRIFSAMLLGLCAVIEVASNVYAVDPPTYTGLTYDYTFNRSDSADLETLTQEVQSSIPDCVGVSRVQDRVVVHLKTQASATLVNQMRGIVNRHVPPPRTPRPGFQAFRTRYRAASTADQKLRILAEWLDFEEVTP